MQTTEDKPILKCENLVVSSRAIAETHGKKVVVRVPSVEIESITLRYGRSVHRPVVAMSIGVVLAFVGLFGLDELIMAPGGYRYELGLIAFGVIGGSLIFDSLKKRFFFEVYKMKGTSRLVFSKTAKREKIQDFCDKVRSIYKYKITETLT